MPSFVQETNRIYRLKIPFEDLYTSCFFIDADVKILVDCGTTGQDVDEYILPALSKMGISLTDITYLVLTHQHGDHAGGKNRILQINPAVNVIEGIRSISVNGITMYALKGHTLDCIGVLDLQTGTLISGDGLQGYGVGKYRCYLESKEEYLKTLDRIQVDTRIKNILFSHAYVPWEKCSVFGREEIEKCIRDCKDHVK